MLTCVRLFDCNASLGGLWWSVMLPFSSDHRHEVWSFAINANETRLLCGSVDSEIRVYVLATNADGREDLLARTAAAGQDGVSNSNDVKMTSEALETKEVSGPKHVSVRVVIM